MSKRDLKVYLKELKKKQLEEQILDLYDRFNEVKTFYNFVFKPKEDKLLEDARFKISKEYFPVNNRKPKTRRSVAQNIIKHFMQLGVDAYIVADVMLFNIEVAQRFSAQKEIKQESFYKSMLKSFEQAVEFIDENKLRAEFNDRILNIITTTKQQNWMNFEEFIQL
ncbi:MAG: hypothetical protein H6589_05230 [Flavobacteriales bacterium]|nr:hypothetical protein [Flavobacteriales bacterium]